MHEHFLITMVKAESLATASSLHSEAVILPLTVLFTEIRALLYVALNCRIGRSWLLRTRYDHMLVRWLLVAQSNYCWPMIDRCLYEGSWGKVRISWLNFVILMNELAICS